MSNWDSILSHIMIDVMATRKCPTLSKQHEFYMSSYLLDIIYGTN